MQTSYTTFYSHILNRNLELEITGEWGFPILMFPTSMGSFVQNRDFKLNESVQHWVDAGKIKLYNIQSLDAENLYNYGLHPHDRVYYYELWVRFLREELLPYIQRECQTHRIAVAGASFGAYHAANFAFRFPDLVSHLFAMSGAFNIRSFMDNYNDLNIYFNSPEEFIPNAESWKYQHMNIVLGTSDQDICRGRNINMSKVLETKGINHWFDEKKWITHDWPLWRMSFPEYISKFF